jgi:hypothetical protein
MLYFLSPPTSSDSSKKSKRAALRTKKSCSLSSFNHVPVTIIYISFSPQQLSVAGGGADFGGFKAKRVKTKFSPVLIFYLLTICDANT